MRSPNPMGLFWLPWARALAKAAPLGWGLLPQKALGLLLGDLSRWALPWDPPTPSPTPETLLSHAVFICSFMVAAPIFGYLGDRFNRKVILSCGIFFWSAVTFSSSFIPQQVRPARASHPTFPFLCVPSMCPGSSRGWLV